MTVTIALGLQWGDEGKGKMVDYLSENADLVIRAAGGANAGHTIVNNDKKYILHHLPSGLIHARAQAYLASGMVIDPFSLLKEIQDIEKQGLGDLRNRIKISPAAHLILPWHRDLEKIREKSPGAIGTTLKGIGPAYESRASRKGLPLGLLKYPDLLKQKLISISQDFAPFFEKAGVSVDSANQVHARLLRVAREIVPMLGDLQPLLDKYLQKDNSEIILEGAQGALLDINHGTYPYVTSSSTISGGLLSGTGLGPLQIDEAVGIMKAYTTRVGNGPFPTEIHGETGHKMAKIGGEFGATTGRPRRCGWLDLVALKHAVNLTGVRDLVITKIDVLSVFEKIKVCTAYNLPSGKNSRFFPEDPWILEKCSPIYKTFPSWNISGNLEVDNIDPALQAFIKMIEEYVGARVSFLSWGPQRHKTLRV
ncbi:MAG: adenylosuccinate synthase [Myxococcota bacterium]